MSEAMAAIERAVRFGIKITEWEIAEPGSQQPQEH